MWQGATFALAINVKNSSGANLDLTGYTAEMQIREAYDSANATEILSSSNGEISFVEANGIIAIELSSARTANIHVDLSTGSIPPKSIYVYDLDIQDANNKVTKLLFGTAEVYGEVTR